MKNLKKVVFVILLTFCCNFTFSQSYWIKEDFASHGISSSYSTFDMETLPSNVILNCVNSNVESADGDCNGQGNSLRVKVDGGYAEFTVPDAGRVRIGLKAKSSNANRIMKVYKNGILDSTFFELDANHCAEYLDTVKTVNPVTYKIASENTGPGVVSYIHVHKYTEGEIVDEDPYIVDEYNINKIWINEVMPSNIDGMMYDTWDFPDSWVEFYNSSNSDSNLLGWKLVAANGEWIIPVDCIVPANGYKVVYLEEKNIGLHAPFLLDIGGDLVTLMRADGTVEDKMPAKFEKNMPPNNSYGRVNDSVDLWGWFLQETPGKTNNTSQVMASDQIAPNVIFSVKGGIYETAQSIILSLPQDTPSILNETNIYYTTDGSEPTQHSTQYAGVISLDTTTVIRAKVISSDYLPRLSVSQTYIIENRNFDLPVISLTLDPEYLWDDTIGIYTDGKNGMEIPACIEGKKNYFTEWRRPMNFEYYRDEKALNQFGEMRISGACSRLYPQKSFIIYGNKRFGEKRYLVDFFDDKKSIDSDGGYKSFMLRNAGQDFNITQFRDAFTQYLFAGKADIDYQAYQPSSVFINGKYWGILNIRERSDEDFILSNYNIKDIEIVESLEPRNSSSYYDELLQILDQETLTYQDISSHIDVVEFINYTVLQMYVANIDWPGNNVVMWYNQQNKKWRWLLKDTDLGFGMWGIESDFNMLNYTTRTEPFYESPFTYESENTFIYRRVFSIPQFQEEFINRFSVYLGDLFHKEEINNQFLKFKENVEEEMIYHKQRWGGNIQGWEAEIQKMKNWGFHRNDYVYEHIQQFFKLGNPIYAKVYSTLDSTIGYKTITINDVEVYRNYFEGKQFQNRNVKISIKDTLGKNFKAWKIKELKNGETKITYVTTREFTHFIDTNCTYFEAFASFEEHIPQNIEWNQDTVFVYNGNNSIELTALASSGLNVEYILKDTIDAIIKDNVLIIKNPNVNSIEITLIQEGNMIYSEAEPLVKTIIIMKKQDVEIFSDKLELKIYPNPPLNGYFWIEVPREGILFINDILGRTILNQKLIVGNNYIDMSKFPKGIYLGNIKIAEEIVNFKITK